MAEIGIPSVSGVQGALVAFGVGGVGGVVYTMAANLLGNSLIGGAVAAALAGSVVKGAKGDVIATIAGFQTGLTLLQGLPTGGGGGGDGEQQTLNVI